MNLTVSLSNIEYLITSFQWLISLLWPRINFKVQKNWSKGTNYNSLQLPCRGSMTSSSTNLLLLALACCDLLTMLFPAPWYFNAFTLQRHASTLWTFLTCSIFEMCTETLPQMFHTASIYLTMALAVQRYLFVCRADLAKRCFFCHAWSKPSAHH